MTEKRNAMMKQMQEENKRLAREKREREQNWRQDQERKNQFEIANVNGSDLMTENPAATKSVLSDSRFIPYNFKGLTPQQVAQIEHERQMQLVEKKQLKSLQDEEARQWAIQQEANRQLMLQNEIELAEKQRQMNEMLKTQHKKDKVEKEQKWTNYYGEQIPLPEV